MEKEFKQQPSQAPGEPADEKLEFLKREEVRTMAKDIAKIREKEAKKEQERIANFKKETEKPKKPQVVLSQQPAPKKQEPLKRPLMQRRPLKRSEKLFIRFLASGVLLFLLLNVMAFGFWYFFQRGTQQPESQDIQQELQAPSAPITPEPTLMEPTPAPLAAPEETAPTPAPEIPLQPLPAQRLDIQDRLVAWGHYAVSFSREVDTLLIHSSYDALGNDPYSVEGVLEEYKIYGVTAHYLIDRSGIIYRLVDDNSVAYHAGVGTMPEGRTNINIFSLGIELLYTTEDSPNEAQYQSLALLTKHLQELYAVPSQNILGHSDTASGRKTDPWNFDWAKFKTMIEE